MFQVGDKVRVVSYPVDQFNPVGMEGVVTRKPCGYIDVNLGFRKALFETDELEHVYTLHNRYSDAIQQVMEENEIGEWWSGLPVEIPFPHKHEELICLPDNETACELKEIFFTLMWLVDDETLNAIIKEL